MTSPNPNYPAGFIDPNTGMPTWMADPNNPWAQQYWGQQWWQGTPQGQQATAQEEQARQYYQDQAEREYALKYAENQRAAKQLELTEGAQVAAQWLARENLKLAKQAQQDARLNSNRSWALQQAQFGLSEDQFAESQLTNDRNFGMGLLDRQAALRGPKTAQQYIDMMDGASSLQPESGFLSRLIRGEYQPARGGTTGRATLADLAGEGVDQGAMQRRRDNDVNLVNRIAQRPQDYANAYRRLPQYQRDYLGGTLEYAGGDENTFVEKMRRGMFANRA